MKLKRFIIFGEILLLMLVMFACGYKVAKEETRELTPEEKEAALITERLREKRYERAVEPYTGSICDMVDNADDNNTYQSDYQVQEEEITEDENAYWVLDSDNNDDWNDWGDSETEAPVVSEKEEKENEVYTFTEDEIWEMTRIVYLENGIDDESTDTTIYLTACVILNRLYDWDECNTVYDVIWENGQYSTANRYTDYNGGELGSSYPYGWERSYNAVCSAIENCDRNPHFQSRSVQGSVYYVDPNTGEIFCY